MRVPISVVLARRKSLAEMLASRQYLPLAEVCARLGVSEATARRDLRVLERDKKITRTYGGALGRFDASYASFADRRTVDHAVKARIAGEALRYIEPGLTCFFDSGTTIFALAEALYRAPVPDLRVVTNSLPVAEMLGRDPGNEVHLLGGRFLQRQSILLGTGARRSARQWNFDRVFMGLEGFNQDGMWASDEEVAAFQRTLITRAKQVFACAIASKLGRETGVFISPWTAKFQLVSNLPSARRARHGLPPAPSP